MAAAAGPLSDDASTPLECRTICHRPALFRHAAFQPLPPRDSSRTHASWCRLTPARRIGSTGARISPSHLDHLVTWRGRAAAEDFHSVTALAVLSAPVNWYLPAPPWPVRPDRWPARVSNFVQTLGASSEQPVGVSRPLRIRHQPFRCRRPVCRRGPAHRWKRANSPEANE